VTARINAAQVLLGDHEPQHVALVCGDECITYGALRNAVARAGATWQGLGVDAGERIAIKLADGIDWVIAWLGAIWAGAVAVAVNPRIPAHEWERIGAEAGFRFVLAEAPQSSVATLALPAWLRALNLAAPALPYLQEPETPAFWSHSSGTSGAPKAVVHAHRCALHAESVARDVLGITRADRLYASSKLFFVYPLANSLFAGLKLGATVILDPAWPTAAQAMRAIAAHRPTVFFSVPSLYRALLLEGHAAQLRSCGIRIAVSAGEALPQALRMQWHAATALALVNGYGASETLCLALVDTGAGAGLVPAPGADVRLVDGAGGAPARVLIRLPTLALGYFNRPGAQADAFRDAGFSPLDLFCRDPAGGWRFVGREDSLVKVRGRWVDLVELEEQLTQACPGIAEAAAVAVTDAQGVTELAFLYTPQPDCDHAGAVLATLLDALPAHRRPRWVHHVAQLPRTPTGKLMRRKLRELHEAQLAASTHDLHATR
jgi:acyl-coenzyme A synthetase/AMP-(fatty) acid ligase